MARFIDLPPELLREILLQVFFNNQVLQAPHPAENNSSLGLAPNPTSPGDSASEYDREDKALRDQALQSYSHEKILNNSFVKGTEVIHQSNYNNAPHYMFSKLHFHHVYKEDLITLSLTCRRLKEAAVPVLWRMVELHTLAREHGEYADYSMIMMPQFLESLVRHQDQGRQVQALSFTVYWRETGIPRDLDGRGMLKELETVQKRIAPLLSSASPISQEDDVRAFIWGLEECFCWPLLLALLPNLRSLKIVLESAPPFWTWYLDSHIIHCVRKTPLLPVLRNIRDLSIIWDGPHGLPFASEIAFLFQLPNLHTLYLGQIVSLDMSQSPKLLDLEDSVGKSDIKELTFDMSILHPTLLQMFLELPRKLEKFTYSLGTPFAGECEGRDIMRALSPHSSSLKFLHISGSKNVLNRAGGAYPIGKRLLNFPLLEDLSVSIWLLVFENLHPRYKLVDVLPPSVLQLNLFVYDDWDFEDWSKELEILFAGKKVGGWKGLHFVGLEYWISNELYEAGSRGREEMENKVAKLVQRGREVGVRLVVETDWMSFRPILDE